MHQAAGKLVYIVPKKISKFQSSRLEGHTCPLLLRYINTCIFDTVIYLLQLDIQYAV